MRRQAVSTDKCACPTCPRFAAAQLPICHRCWTLASDEEQQGLKFSIHAPFARRWGDDIEEGDVAITDPFGALEVRFSKTQWSTETYVDFIDHGAGDKKLWSMTVGQFLNDFERRSTLAALAVVLDERRRATAFPGD